MERFVDGFFTLTIYLGPFFLLLAIGGIFSDYIMPRCPRLTRFLERILDVDLGGGDYE